jgi:cystathionine beta-synthase
LLPDSAARYLNKVFDDDWMRENGFLDPEMSLGTIRDLLRTKSQNVTTINKDATVRDAVGLMKKHGISQVPVMEGHHLAGLVTESRLLDLMIQDGERGLDIQVGQVLSNAYELVDPDAPMSPYQQSFSKNKVLVVWERGEVRGLVTKIDMIEYLSRHNSATSEASY